MRGMVMSLFMLCVMLVCSASVVRAQCDVTFERVGEIPGVDRRVHNSIFGTIYDAVEWDPDGGGPQPSRLVVGGVFRHAGSVFSPNVAAWDGERWQAVGSGLGTLGGEVRLVRRLAVLNGRLYATGEANGQAFVCWWTGAFWWRIATIDGQVQDMEVFQNELYIAGNFTRVGAVESRMIARWDGTRWLAVPGLIPQNVGGASVASLTTIDHQLFVSGQITGADGVASTGIVAWDGSAWSGLNGGIGGYILDAIRIGDEIVMVGPLNRHMGGEPWNWAYRIVRWDGTNWHAFATPLMATASSDYVKDIEVFDGDVYVAGVLATGTGLTDVVLARNRGALWEPLARDPDASVHKLVRFRGELIAAGSLYRVGNHGVSNIVRWTGTEWRPLGTGLASDQAGSARVMDLLPTPTGGILIGNFISYGSTVLRRIAEYRDGAIIPFGEGIEYTFPSNFTSGGLWDLFEHGGTLMMGGMFGGINGVPCNSVAAWTGDAWEPIGDGVAGGLHRVRKLLDYQGQLIAIGNFENSGGAPAKGVAVWNEERWAPLGGGMNINSSLSAEVSTWVEYRGELIVSGTFSDAGGVPAENIAAWNGFQWRPLGAGLDVGASDLIVWNDQLYACGLFRDSGPLFVRGFARWDGQGWTPAWEGLTSPGQPTSMLVDGDSIILSGFVQLAPPLPVSDIVRWDGSTFQVIGTIEPGNTGKLVRMVNGDIAVIGGFDLVNGGVSPAFALMRSPGPNVHTHPASALACEGDTIVLRVGATGNPPLAYEWMREGTPVVDGQSQSGAIVSGASTAELTISGMGAGDLGAYRCRVSNLCDVAHSEVAVVAACPCLADWDLSGGVDGDDIGAFFEDWQAGDADIDGSGGTDGDDIGFFFERWQAGC